MKIGHQKDFWGGVLFAVIGLMFLAIARGVPGLALMPGYSMGTPARMGPGFFPFYLGSLLCILGVVIAVGGIRGEPNAESGVEKFHWKPILYVLGSVVMFGILLKPLGMLLAGLMLVVVASMGSHDFRPKAVAILAVVLTVFCAFVFVGGLKLPIPLCPDVESLQASIKFCRS